MTPTSEVEVRPPTRVIDIRRDFDAGDSGRHGRDQWRPTPRQVRLFAIFAMWLAAVLGTCWLMGSERVPAGTVVAGVDIGGLEREAAIDALNQTMGPQVQRPIKLRAGDKVVRVEPADAGLVLDAEATVDRLLTSRWKPWDLWHQWFGGGDFHPTLNIDVSQASSELRRATSAVLQPVVEPKIVYDGLKLVVQPGKDGLAITDEAVAALASGFPGGRGAVEIPTGQSSPAVSRDQAYEVARGIGRRAVFAPVELRVQGRTFSVQPGQIAKALTFEVRDGNLEPRVNPAKLRPALAGQLAQVERPVRNATWDVSGSKPVLVPSQEGLGIRDDALASAVEGVLDREGSERVADLELAPLKPKHTTAEVEKLGIIEPLASFTQDFDYAAYRVQNIGLAARKVDGTLLKPGETFSLNDTVGERTAEAGFTTGPVVGAGGRFREDLGGGVSTVATTLWTAAFFAGLERVEQGAHLIWISRYRPGLEATVYWGYLDLKFRNDTPDGVLISAKSTNTSVTVTLWGKKQYDRIEARTGPRENVKPFATVTDSSDSCLPQSGVDGFDIAVDRIFIRDGREVRKQRFNTHYIPGNAAICTKEKANDPKSSASAVR
ncbi:MAG: VanW family protein [Candidatus Nanopelagicales bacterium]|nr:VanW family protein [Candidatus Nanopelagicales bacterium]